MNLLPWICLFEKTYWFQGWIVNFPGRDEIKKINLNNWLDARGCNFNQLWKANLLTFQRRFWLACCSDFDDDGDGDGCWTGVCCVDVLNIASGNKDKLLCLNKYVFYL